MNGKSCSFLALFTATAMTVSPALSMPRPGESSGRHFLVVAEDLSAWHAGAYVRSQDRTVKRNRMETSVEVTRGMAYVGYDVLPWMTLYGAIGLSNTDPEEWFGDSETAVEYGVGAWFNLLDHDTFDFLETVDRYRLQAVVQYTFFDNDDMNWGELSGNVTFGLTNEVIGNKFLWPDAITLYAGPAFNIVHSNEYDLSSGNMFGATVGIDVQVNKRTSLGLAGEFYSDDNAILGSVGIRF